MRRKFVKPLLIVSAILVLLAIPNGIFSCGPFFDETVYAFRESPNTMPSDFAAGKLGIVRPSFRSSFLVVSYRYLSGLPLNAAQQDSAQKVWNREVTISQDEVQKAADDWNKEKAKIPNAATAEISPYSPVSPTDQYEQFLNCPVDAFHTAVHTLDDRLAKFGAASDGLKQWVTAQDQVFSNCAGQASAIPAVLTSGDPLLRADRNYQIAAAHFYARDFDQSVAAFDAIAKDKTSPWAAIAPYLAARALVRKANLNHADKSAFDADTMAAAQQRLEKIVADQHAAAHDAAQKILDFVRFRTEPEKRAAELEQTLLSRDPGSNFKQNLWDYVVLTHQKDGGDLDQWISGLALLRADEATSPDANAAEAKNERWSKASGVAVSKWRQTKSLPWLISALALSKPQDAATAELLKAANGVPESSAGYLTVRYYALKKMIALGQADAARTELDKLLARDLTQTPQGTKNLLNDERQKLATSLEDFLAHASEMPVAVGSDPDFGENIPLLAPTDKNAKAYLTPYATEVLVKRLPLAMLVDAAQSATLPKHLRREIARTAWVRAILVEDFATAAKLQTALQELDKPLWTSMDGFRNATNDDEKRFAGILVILDNPGMKPSVVEGELRGTTLGAIDNFRDNWWCPDMGSNVGGMNYSIEGNDGSNSDNAKSVEKDPDFPFPAFLSDAQKTQTRSEWQKLLAVGTAPNYLANQAIAYGKGHAQNPNVPEALAQSVRATHFGCADAETPKLSKAAFDLLHQKYPSSPWTAKTKYHY